MNTYDPNNHTLRACLFDIEAGRLLQERCEAIAAGCGDAPSMTLQCRDGEHGTDTITTRTFEIDGAGCFSLVGGR